MTPQTVKALQQRLGADRLQRGVALAPYTTFKIGGAADLYYEAHTADELAEVIHVARALDVPHFLLGKGANILVGDRGFRGFDLSCLRGPAPSVAT